MAKRTWKEIILASLGLLVIVALVFSLLSGCGTVDNETFDQVVEIDDNGEIAVTEGNEERFNEVASEVKLRSETSIIKDIHKMANTVVIAEQKWGKDEITEESINGLIIEIKAGESKKEYVHSVELLDILVRWKQGDFSQADQDHNFVWDLLNGTVGKATGVYEPGIPEWAKTKLEAEK